MSTKNITNGSAPFYDDADVADANDYYKILYRPGYAQQARELTQSQSLIHKQIKRLGDHFFKNGSVVIPGRISFDTRFAYVLVNIPALHASRALIEDAEWRTNNLLNGTIENADGIVAKIVNVDETIDVDDNIRLFVKYQTANVTTNVFGNNQALTTYDPDAVELFTANSKTTGATGVGSSATITEGIYYVRGLFVSVRDQTIILDNASDTPNYSVGLEIQEAIITENIDSNLTDPASGTSNFAAPGAHRWQIKLVLSKKDLNDSFDANDYVELLRLENGRAVKKIDRTLYNILGDELARRTSDESGDYTLSPFPATLETHPLSDTALRMSIEPGKAYVKGYEIETISKTYIPDIDKARDFTLTNNTTIRAQLGNYLLVKNVLGIPDTNNYASVNLLNYAGATIGTAKVRGLVFDSSQYDITLAASTNVYKLYLFDVSTIAGSNFASVYSVSGTGFTANTFLSLEKLEGTVTATSSTALLGSTVTRWATDPNQSLALGDYIVVEQDTGDAASILRVTATPTTNLNLAVAAITSFTFAEAVDKNFYYARANLVETSKNRLVFPLPNSYIKKIRGTGGVIDTNYQYRKYFTAVVGVSNVINLATGTADEEFISSSISDYIVTNTDASGAVLTIASLNLTGNTMSITISGGSISGANVKIIAPIKKLQGSASQEKVKTLSSNQTYTYVTASPTGVNSGTTAREFWIPKPDIFRLISVVADSIDITHQYEFDNGQRDNYYDLGKLKLKPGFPVPTASIVVTYDYFIHSGALNYFSVDSYSVDLVQTGKGYEYIPSYVSPIDGAEFSLRDCLDFRPTINDTRTGFSSTTALMTTDVSADYEYYLNRIDKVYLDTKGIFHVIKGVSALDPKTPEDPTDGMVLYTLKVRAYTLTPADVFLEFRENKRYTMRDIGKLEKRIENLEYYTTLSLLEKETQDLEITDELGLDRFKNGFIVDPFNGHGIGDVSNPDYKCSIDIDNAQVRPEFKSKSVDLVEINTLDAQRTSNHYQKTGDLITLPYTEKSLVEQTIATNFMNVNPYNVFTFLGRIGLNPEIDNWKETKQLPDVIVNQQGNYDSMLAMANAYGTVWGEWETQWHGTSIEVSRSSQIIDRGTNKADAVHKKNWPVLRETTRTTTEIKSGTTTRTGTVLRVVPKTVTTELENKVVDLSYIPFMRTKDVKFVAKGFKPNVRLYAFFDDENVSQYTSTGTVYNPAATINSTPLVTDATGKAEGVFRIPNSDSIKFKTGKRKFTLTNSSTNSQLNSSTSGSAIYEASGLLETKRKTIISTRNAVVSQETLIENVAVESRSSSSTTKTKWEDPLAQSFLCTTAGGAFITSIDLFLESKDANIPLIISIREMENGYPSQRILPFSEVILDSADCIVNEFNDNTKQLVVKEDGETNIVINNATSANLVATNKKFLSPVYLQENVEYCAVLISNSNEYNVWIARGKENKIGTSTPVQSQPYVGSLFKSQNASTWTADQEADLKFKIYAADFDISTTGICDFTNAELEVASLISDPFTYKYVNNGNVSQKIRVAHQNHGLLPGSFVTIEGADDFGPFLAAQLNDTHEIVSVELDSYIIAITADSADNSPTPLTDELVRGGGDEVTATENATFDSLYPNVRQISLPSTAIDFQIKTTSSANIHDTVTVPYAVDSSYSPILANETSEFTKTKLICSEDNLSELSGAARSLYFRTILASDNENISPVIDIQALNVIAVANRITNPTHANTNVAIIDDLTIASDISIDFVISSQTDRFRNTDGGDYSKMIAIKPGRYITIGDTVANNGTYLVKEVNIISSTIVEIVVDGTFTDVTDAVTDITMHTRYVADFSVDEGSSASKYITRKVQLAQPATSIKIMVAGYRPGEIAENIEIYYKTLPVDSSSRFEDLLYEKATLDFIVQASASTADFKDYEFTIDNLPEFSVMSCKIVFKGINSANPPACKDLRLIALA